MTATNDPEPCDLLVAGGRVLDLAASAGVDDHAAIAIRAGFIVAVGDEAEIRSAWRPLRRIDAAGQVVAPGFVDAHVHLSACPDLDAAVRNHRRRRCRKLRNRRARTSSVDVGIRAAIGPSLTDQWHDPAGRLVRQADVGELLAGIAALAKDRDIPTHVHSHISEGSTKAHLEFFHRTQTARLQNAGLLSERCIVMHAGWLNDDDIAAFGSARVRANHNSVGNAMLGFGTVRAGSVLRLLTAGVPIVLGSDFAPFNISTPLETMRATLLLHRDLFAADNALTLEQALAMATNGSAVLGRTGQPGVIAVGRRADLILVDITGPHHLGVDHPVPALALHGRAADVTTVIVDGRVVIDQRRLVGIDEHEITEAARRALDIVAHHG